MGKVIRSEKLKKILNSNKQARKDSQRYFVFRSFLNWLFSYYEKSVCVRRLFAGFLVFSVVAVFLKFWILCLVGFGLAVVLFLILSVPTIWIAVIETKPEKFLISEFFSIIFDVLVLLTLGVENTFTVYKCELSVRYLRRVV